MLRTAGDNKQWVLSERPRYQGTCTYCVNISIKAIRWYYNMQVKLICFGKVYRCIKSYKIGAGKKQGKETEDDKCSVDKFALATCQE